MEIVKNTEGNTFNIALVGRLDTTTAPDLETVLQEITPEIAELIFDFKDLEYISSAGLRVLLAAQKIMNKQGKMLIRNACENIMEVFSITGFSDILTIE